MTEFRLHVFELDISHELTVVVEDKEAARESNHDVVAVNVGTEVVVVGCQLRKDVDETEISKWLHDDAVAFKVFSFQGLVKHCIDLRLFICGFVTLFITE